MERPQRTRINGREASFYGADKDGVVLKIASFSLSMSVAEDNEKKKYR